MTVQRIRRTVSARAAANVWLLILLLVFAHAGGVFASAQSKLVPGDAVVTDDMSGTDQQGVLFRVDPATGHRDLLTDFGNAAQGPVGCGPFGVAIAPSGQVLVVCVNAGTDLAGALVRVNLDTGNRVMVSDFGNFDQGFSGGFLDDVAVEPSGKFLVSDFGFSGVGTLFRVDPTTGNRGIVSDFSDPTQGPVGVLGPAGIAVEGSGQILAADLAAGTDFFGEVFRVHPATGERVVLSDFGDPSQGPLGTEPDAVAVDPFGHILVLCRSAGSGLAGAIFRVDPSTGHRTLVSDFGDLASGPVIFSPLGVATQSSGQILVIGFVDGQAVVARVDPATGQRALVSNFVDPSQGPLGVNADGIAVVPGVPFSQFTVKLEIELDPGLNDDGFELKSSFTLGPGSNGIYPLTEPLRLVVGRAAITIPAGRFRQDKHGHFEYEGTIAGAHVEAMISPLGGNRFSFKAEVHGVELNYPANLVKVFLVIGDDLGRAQVNAEIG